MMDKISTGPRAGRSILKLDHVPHGLKEILAYYGDPDTDDDLKADREWEIYNLTNFTLPFYLVPPWDENRQIHSLTMHKKVGQSLIDALYDFGEAVGVKTVHKEKWDRCAGTFVFRAQRGDPAWLSAHSWGIAIDLNPQIAGYGKPSDVPNQQPPELVEAFESRGWMWGGRWPEMNAAWPGDYMHFQACTGY